MARRLYLLPTGAADPVAVVAGVEADGGGLSVPAGDGDDPPGGEEASGGEWVDPPCLVPGITVGERGRGGGLLGVASEDAGGAAEPEAARYGARSGVTRRKGFPWEAA